MLWAVTTASRLCISLVTTSMHSNRMTYPGGGLHPGGEGLPKGGLHPGGLPRRGVCMQGGLPNTPRMICLRGVCPGGGRGLLGGLHLHRGGGLPNSARSAYGRGGIGQTPLWTEWLTDRCKNITFPQLHLWAVITIGRFHVVSLGNGIKYPTEGGGRGRRQGQQIFFNSTCPLAPLILSFKQPPDWSCCPNFILQVHSNTFIFFFCFVVENLEIPVIFRGATRLMVLSIMWAL